MTHVINFVLLFQETTSDTTSARPQPRDSVCSVTSLTSNEDEAPILPIKTVTNNLNIVDQNNIQSSSQNQNNNIEPRYTSAELFDGQNVPEPGQELYQAAINNLSVTNTDGAAANSLTQQQINVAESFGLPLPNLVAPPSQQQQTQPQIPPAITTQLQLPNVNPQQQMVNSVNLTSAELNAQNAANQALFLNSHLNQNSQMSTNSLYDMIDSVPNPIANNVQNLSILDPTNNFNLNNTFNTSNNSAFRPIQRENSNLMSVQQVLDQTNLDISSLQQSNQQTAHHNFFDTTSTAVNSNQHRFLNDNNNITCATLGAETAAFLQNAGLQGSLDANSLDGPPFVGSNTSQNALSSSLVPQQVGLHHQNIVTPISQFTIPQNIYGNRPEPPRAPPPIMTTDNLSMLITSPTNLNLSTSHHADQSLEFNVYNNTHAAAVSSLHQEVSFNAHPNSNNNNLFLGQRTNHNNNFEDRNLGNLIHSGGSNMNLGYGLTDSFKVLR